MSTTYYKIKPEMMVAGKPNVLFQFIPVGFLPRDHRNGVVIDSYIISSFSFFLFYNGGGFMFLYVYVS